MEESKLASKCYFCENRFSHDIVIFGFDPAKTQICHAKNDTTVQAPATIIKEVIVPSEAEHVTDDTCVISTTTSGELMDFRNYKIPKLNTKKKEEAEKTTDTSVISTTTSGQLMDFRSYKIPKLIKMEEDVRSL